MMFDFMEPSPATSVPPADYIPPDPPLRRAAVPANPLDLTPARADAAEFSRVVDDMLAQAKAVEINDEESNTTAIGMAAQAKKIGKRIEDARKRFVAAPNEFVKAVNGLFKDFVVRLDRIEEDLKGKSRRYKMAVEMERRKAEAAALKAAEELQAKIDAEAKAANVEPVKIAPPVVMAETPKVVRTEFGSASTRKVWKHRVINPTAVPREYLVVDESKIRQAVKDGLREIPGVEIYEDEQIAIRA